LDYGARVHRHHFVYGLLCVPLPASGGKAGAYQPENNKLEWSLAIVTTVAVAALLGPGLFVWYQFVTVPDGAAEIEVVGQQWQWSFRLPGKDGRLGTTDPRYISSDNPLGLNPNDPNGQDNIVIVADDLHLPLGTCQGPAPLHRRRA
jgi:cytochrome c oxidase subunit II